MMPRHSVFALSILALSITATVWIPTVQAETNLLRREFYGPVNPELFAAFLDDHGLPREKVGQSDRYLSRLRGGGNVARLPARSGVGKSNYDARDGQDERLSRNLDQIGAGNLLRGASSLSAEREGSSYDGRWSRRNLDQIGGGNLLREADSRGERNLDSIGGGNLVRGANLRLDRNLDQIGGGNLVRSLTDPARRPVETVR
ncbi:orcokinin peptides isoform X1 [Apis mellifera caucasica]|uniref:Orcokinin peptides isoform X1 n=1 Tax=Apis mellifera TaxID=7460 RepID=A0A7M7II70_APIME|nr:orcokinin peptides isoform X1 [Apis mellifera]KAG6800036.1 orcokinin peptides isoform X1 [Apis mellifera caucasica]|eukprot:XP_016770158.1 orcokinin peptides isoform X1 [Apis mellifera]